MRTAEELGITCPYCNTLTERTPIGRFCPKCEIHFTFFLLEDERKN